LAAVAARQEEVVATLLEPRFHSGAPVEHRETHISHVFLVGDRAYKLKKALVLPFVDYGTLERRHFFCREEIRLNRPLAPTVYVGVRAVIRTQDSFTLGDEDDPRAAEYLVEMRRFNENATLDALVRSEAADESVLRRVGDALARLHRKARHVAVGHGSSLLQRRVDADLAQLAGVCTDHDTIVAASQARAFVARAGAELDARAGRGLVREGHGDLRLEHILVRDEVEVVDCVEFDRSLRVADVAYDLAFALMELHDQELPRRADELTAGYRSAGGDPGNDRTLAGLAGCRALVRAKVAALRSPPRPGELERLLRTARRLFWIARGPLTVIVCGPAGVGKTTLAAQLAKASGLHHLSSDVVRKALAGVSPTARLAASSYTSAAARATYAELGRRARERAAAGGSIVDATFRHRSDRASFDAVFADAPGARVVLRLEASAEQARERAVLRAAGSAQPSDAGPEQALVQAAEFEPLERWCLARSATVDASLPRHAVAELAESSIDRVLVG
jgi:hypothetical protein